jgi:hypothetical protein
MKFQAASSHPGVKSWLTIASRAANAHYQNTRKTGISLIYRGARPITPQNNEGKAIFYWASFISKNTFPGSFHESRLLRSRGI